MLRDLFSVVNKQIKVNIHQRFSFQTLLLTFFKSICISAGVRIFYFTVLNEFKRKYLNAIIIIQINTINSRIKQ